MKEETEFSQIKIIECMAVIDIDPTLTHLKPAQQKWISSIQLLTDVPKQLKPGSKVLNIFYGLYLVINFCEKNRLPIYQIDFLSQPGPQWIPIKMPYSFADKFVDSFLCYKTQQPQLTQPLGDIDVINTERKSHHGHDKQVISLPNGYKLVSNPIFQSFLVYKRMKSRLQQTFKPIILESYPEKHSINLGLIPSFCFPEGIKLSRDMKSFITFSFILTQQTGDRLYVTYLTFKELLNENLKSKLDVRILENIYYDKGFCVISKYKFTDQMSECLQHLYRLSMSRNDQPFFKVAQNFINELKMPKQITTHGFSYSYNGCNILFDYDPVIQTVSDKSIYCMLKFLPLQQFLTVFKAILYERQVIFASQSKTVIGFAMEAFTSLLFPFKWENVIIPIVPQTMKEYLTAPVPYLAGINTSQLIDISVESEVVIVLLDTGKVMNDEDLPPLPEKLNKQLLKRLQEFQYFNPDEVNQYLENPQNTYMFKTIEVQHPQFKGLFVREAFFEFFTTLMKNYKKYWRSKLFKDFKETFAIKSTQTQVVNEIFKVQDFMSDLGINKVGSFGYKFTQCAIFTAYLERRYFSTSDPVANFFDQCLQKKKNKKFEGLLLVKPQKLRYIVSKHPDPEKEKIFYSYVRFPSILAEPSSKQILQESIQIQFQEQQIFSQAEFYEFLEEQRQLYQGFYQAARIQQYKIEQYMCLLNLLTNKNKELFAFKCKQGQSSNKKYFEVFKYIYEFQLTQIQRLFDQWPKYSKNAVQFVKMRKNDYMKLKLQRKSFEQVQQKLISVWNQTNLEIIIKESIKIIVVSSYTENISRQSKSSSLTSSNCRPSFQTVYVYIPSFRIKQFLNQIFPIQPEQVFNFIYNKVKNGSDNVWNIETVIELKQFIEKISRQDYYNEDKFATGATGTQKTLSLQYQKALNQKGQISQR